MRINTKLLAIRNGLYLFEPFGLKQDLEPSKLYTLDIKEYKSNRSLEQNRMMWGIIQQISTVTGNDEMSIYISGLEHANAKYEFIAALPETETSLKKVFRAISPLGTLVTPKGVELVTYKCYIGSSKFDTGEMTRLIDYFITKAQEVGINIETV